jgi:ABC-type glycerol-3-phosphate transport system permease component
MTFVGSTHDQTTMLRAPLPLWPGEHMLENYRTVLFEGFGTGAARTPLYVSLINSLIMALGVCVGKIAISIIAAYAVVYFRFPLRMFFFWDGAGPVRFFIDILLPMSRTSIAALFVIQFIYGWNQYLWPLLITTREGFYTVVMTLSRQVNTVDAAPSWNWIMAMAMLAMLPPVLVVVFMQRQFVKGLVDTEK